MKTAIADMDERPSAFDRVDRFRAPADDRWAVPVRRSVRRTPELPRPRREHLLRLLEPRRRHDWALLAAIRDAYVTGGATRRVEALARVLGVDGLNDEDVVHAAHELDRRLLTFRSRPLVAVYPYLVIDAIGQKVRERGRVQSHAVIVVVGVAATGMREILAIEIDDPEQPATWSRLLRGLRDRGVYGVRLVTADAFPGITPAIAEAFVGASFQRSRSRLIRDVTAQVAEGDRPALSAQLRTVFRQDDRIAAQSRLRRIPEAFGLNPTLVQ
ncbi:MAG TPA: transposase, partial [Candidatus Limnocylindrales bacterium]|nr:transposase [Candidatus Limnocylindrales bacterium]